MSLDFIIIGNKDDEEKTFLDIPLQLLRETSSFTIFKSSFPFLRELTIMCCDSIDLMEIEGANLEKIFIRYCGKLTSLKIHALKLKNLVANKCNLNQLVITSCTKDTVCKPSLQFF